MFLCVCVSLFFFQGSEPQSSEGNRRENIGAFERIEEIVSIIDSTREGNKRAGFLYTVYFVGSLIVINICTVSLQNKQLHSCTDHLKFC